MLCRVSLLRQDHIEPFSILLTRESTLGTPSHIALHCLVIAMEYMELSLSPAWQRGKKLHF